MPDDTRGSEPTMPPPSAPRPSFARRHWGKLLIAAVIHVPTLGFFLWSVVSLSFSYSSGERVGFVQKLSKKGWLCKTWEGELQMSNVPGSAPMLFQFTVRSDSLARVIEDAAGKQVALHYEQNMGVPSSCFGDTEYFVVAARVVNR